MFHFMALSSYFCDFQRSKIFENFPSNFVKFYPNSVFGPTCEIAVTIRLRSAGSRHATIAKHTNIKTSDF